MDRVVPAGRAELLQLQPVLVLLLVLRRSVVAVLTITALQCNDFAHRFLALSIQLSAISFQKAPARGLAKRCLLTTEGLFAVAYQPRDLPESRLTAESR
jgi:hypothetical protein